MESISGAMENNDKVALAVAFSTTLGGIMAIVKLAMGLWTMSVLFIVSAVYYADKLFTPVATTLIYSISVVLFPKYNLTYSQVNAQR